MRGRRRGGLGGRATSVDLEVPLGRRQIEVPTASLARTRKLWAPSVSFAVVLGEAQATQAPASTLHWNVEPAWPAVNANVGVASRVGPDGPEVMVVCGGVASTVTVRVAGVGSAFCAGESSIART